MADAQSTSTPTCVVPWHAGHAMAVSPHVDHRCVLLGNARTIGAQAHYAIPAKSMLVSDNIGNMTVHAAGWKALLAGCVVL